MTRSMRKLRGTLSQGEAHRADSGLELGAGGEERCGLGEYQCGQLPLCPVFVQILAQPWALCATMGSGGGTLLGKMGTQNIN